MTSLIPSTALFSVTLFLITLSSLKIQARELTSFGKALGSELPDDATNIPQRTWVKTTEGEQPETLPPQSQNGYGLYGRPEEYFPTTTTSSSYSGIPRTEFNGKSFDDREANAVYPNDQDESYKNEVGINKLDGEGMSDTRTVENGKYFYDVNGDSHGEAYNFARSGSVGRGVYGYDPKGNGYEYQNQETEQAQYSYP
ncbi:hypothetical protein HPP92_008633 [Vanilla planifolia]|uniref:Uncharacterized protein n=1 Tax=Vanilla planifolia TaxID=51239 RepID=A0A835RA05_VANPL|nr:hypothetical protein HPP92_008633 [Vanilla planifolia]